MKILSPAGNFECLKMAIYNGADEVYLGINDFNARNNIDGFNLNSLTEAVDFAHVFNVKVNLAINILFSDEELQKALDTIVKAYNIGVDSFIIQDLGLAYLVNKNYSNIEIHASTQMAIHNLEGVKYLENFGFKRIVLARETPLNEIKRIKENTSVELEYFAQGALCVSFSGNCYLSSYLFNASGNRGRCKQLCRLPYTLLKNNKALKRGYLLSAKDFNMINRLDDLKNAGINVIKIEGRARRPFYVASATREYYNRIHGNPINQDNLKLGFNREYTEGYFNGNSNIVSNIQNHIGIYVGKVEKVNIGKNFNEIYFSSNRELSPKSTFKIINNNQEKTTLSAYDLKEVSKGKYKLTTTQELQVNDNIHLIIDYKKEFETLSTFKKKEISLTIKFEENKEMLALFKHNNKTYEIYGEKCELAQNQPLTPDDLKNNFSKSDLFSCNLDISLDRVFVTKQKLNEFRRNVFNKVFTVLTSPFKHNEKYVKIKNDYKLTKFEDFAIVDNLNHTFTKKHIIYSPEIYSLEEVFKFINKCNILNKTPFLDTPNFALEKDINFLKDIVDRTKINIIANNYYALNFNTNVVIGAGLNVYNHITASIFNKPIISAENNISTKINYPYMTLRHCPMKEHLNASCENCPYSNNYSYKMDDGTTLKLKRKKLSTCTFYLAD